MTLRGSGVEVEDVADIARLPSGVANGVPRVSDFKLRQFFNVRVNDGGETSQQPRTIGWRNSPPARGRLHGAGDCQIGLLQVEHLNRADRLLG